jgi:hypothetical protein
VELFEDRAIQAAHALRTFARTSEFRSDFMFEELIVPGTDGERRATFDELPGWWQRLRIARQPDGALKFEALTDRARAEASLLPTQQTMVQGLLDRAIRTTATDLDLSATLFELLVPRQLKEQAPDRRELVLIVDETSAMLPWELLHDRWNAGARPLSVDAGMVRQFSTTEFRPRVQRAPSNTALVVGDPPLDGSRIFKQLPGAAAEARAVAAVLHEHEFETTALIGNDAQWPAVLSSLYGHSYRILHIAAHGVYEFDPEEEKPTGTEAATAGGPQPRRPTVTGVVLGSGAFLTPSEFEQLRVVPDLVFINCCHLGRDGDFGRTIDVKVSRLAANVAQQLIRMGVRAVVAAGWAVDDQAGVEFARRFYASMLAGQEFGQAVLTARQEIYMRFGAANTWGAYQCYGDPGFTLEAVDRSRENGTFVAELELLIELERLGRNVRGADESRRAALERRLEHLVAAAPASWLKSGRMCAAIAGVYSELGRFEKAVDYSERVLIGYPATARLKDVEQLANQLARLAAAQQPPSVRQLERSAGMLRQLSHLGRTSERTALRGSTAKRYAQGASGKKRLEALREMTEAYRQGYEDAVKNQVSNAWYPLQNVVAGKAAIGWQRGAQKKLWAGIADDLVQLRDLAARVPERSTDFWETCLPIDVALVEAIVDGQLSPAQRKKIGTHYIEAFTRGTAREVQSAIDHIEFLQEMASSSPRKPIRDLAESLGELVGLLKPDADRHGA